MYRLKGHFKKYTSYFLSTPEGEKMHFVGLVLTQEAGSECCFGEDEPQPVSGRQVQVDVK